MVATPREVRKIKKKIKNKEDSGMERFRKLGLILVILLVGTIILTLTGCNIIVTPDCCQPVTPPPAEDCYLVITAGYWIWGGVYANDEYVGPIDFVTNPILIIDVACGTWVRIYIIDVGCWQSHTEIIFIHPGKNELYFPFLDIDKDIDRDIHRMSF